MRQGRVVPEFETVKGLSPMAVVDAACKFYKKHDLKIMFIDKVGLGAGIYDRMKELGFRVNGVNAGEQASKPDRYFNKRAEMWGDMAEWFEDHPVSIPDDDEFQADLMCVRRNYNSNSVLQLEPKTKIRKDFGRSPDLGDALAHTFAYPVARSAKPVHVERNLSPDAWMS